MHLWTIRLAELIANALTEFRGKVKGRIECLAVDCHPWNGTLDLAILTHAEVLSDPLLATPNEMAAWKYFHFTSALTPWKHVDDLALQMQKEYENASSDRAQVVN